MGKQLSNASLFLFRAEIWTRILYNYFRIIFVWSLLWMEIIQQPLIRFLFVWQRSDGCFFIVQTSFLSCRGHSWCTRYSTITQRPSSGKLAENVMNSLFGNISSLGNIPDGLVQWSFKSSCLISLNVSFVFTMGATITNNHWPMFGQPKLLILTYFSEDHHWMIKILFIKYKVFI